MSSFYRFVREYSRFSLLLSIKKAHIDFRGSIFMKAGKNIFLCSGCFAVQILLFRLYTFLMNELRCRVFGEGEAENVLRQIKN